MADLTAAEPVRVVASIKPLALMVEEIAGAQAEVAVLVRPGQTPHDFAFKVSDRQRLAEADLLVWVGPSLEPYLAGLADEGKNLSMAAVLEVTDHQPDHHHSHPHDHHSPGQIDQHFWLNPVYGHAMVGAIANELARLDPPNADLYHSNALRIAAQLEAIPVAPAPRDEKGLADARRYAVVHQAFDYFLDYFPYPRPLVLTPVPEISPGARQLWRAGEQLQPGDCLMVESRNPGKWVQTFSERNDLRIRLVDIMGYEEEVSTYPQLLANVKSVFDDCAE